MKYSKFYLLKLLKFNNNIETGLTLIDSEVNQERDYLILTFNNNDNLNYGDLYKALFSTLFKTRLFNNFSNEDKL